MEPKSSSVQMDDQVCRESDGLSSAHHLVGKNADLRGTYRNGVVGPKIGRRVGRQAGKEGKVVQYRSARNGGSNYFVPKRLFDERPNVVRPVKIER